MKVSAGEHSCFAEGSKVDHVRSQRDPDPSCPARARGENSVWQILQREVAGIGYIKK